MYLSKKQRLALSTQHSAFGVQLPGGKTLAPIGRGLLTASAFCLLAAGCGVRALTAGSAALRNL